MKVLITGATGLVGSELVKLCKKENIAVNYLTTSKEKIKNQPGYCGFYWNPKKGKIDKACLEGVDKVINLVGASVSKPWTASHKKAIINSRIDSANLFENDISFPSLTKRMIRSSPSQSCPTTRLSDISEKPSTIL